LLKASHKTGVRLIGPNCIGIYNPASRMTMASDFSMQPGNVAYVAQSGDQCSIGIREANGWGINFSTAISYGNAADINECDLIEYFTNDPKTAIIVIYIEGTRDGPRMIRALSEATRKKPVIVYKGGDD
jgi:acyl-CoA synthetase (NDP forming)